MNILSEDGKSVINLKTWDEVFERPGFKRGVDPTEIQLKRIIGKYDFSDENHCGLSSCNTSHKKGYLVVCSNNIETNIGHKCGKKHFGVDFKELERTFRKDINIRNARENIQRRSGELEFIRERVGRMWQPEGLEFFCKVRDLKLNKEGITGALRVKLERRAKSGDEKVFDSVRASEADIVLEEERLRRELTESEKQQLMVSVPVGIIYGVRAFNSFSVIRDVLHDEMPALLNELDALDTSLLTDTQLLDWSKRLNSIDVQIMSAQDAIEDCRRFLVDSNIKFIKQHKHLI
ncbi:hypothetical protein R1T43_19165 [Alteromonas sp. CI.11.F.A3]|uniref:hypothetical protein n=1 Tax=Alteromonas sp. CI.11.F.A3 TaxID=3079555 RepID=UPI002943D6DD|nr:hypothetical protein [Alteromonas sp. CI.11.F.A3]WOI37283.1 hypothetical protein R1T43_19165 [Alteromonas sp. CI.11.F.A3]